MTIKFGVTLRFRNLPEFDRPWPAVYSDNIAIGVHADEVGFDGVWVAEHHSVQEGYNPTPFVALAALSTVTKRVRLGTQPLLLPLYHPVHVAEQACVIDVISHGRMILGLGAGYRQGDFLAFGRSRADRKELMDEGCELLDLCFRSDRPFTYSGRHFQVSDVDISPRSVQQPRPTMFYTVRSKAAARRAGRWGYSANIMPAQGDALELCEEYVAALETNDHDPSTCELAVMVGGVIAETEDRTHQILASIQAQNQYDKWRMEGGSLDIGDRRLTRPVSPANRALTPDTFTREIEQLCTAFEKYPVQLGWLSMTPWPEGMSTEDGKHTLDLIAEQVVPRFR